MPLLDVIPIFGPWRIRRDARKFEQWCLFVGTHKYGADIFEIVGIRQKARTGSKAYGKWLFTGEVCALWIDGAWPSVGMFMSAPGSYGDGLHHSEEVFYAKQPYHFLDHTYRSAMQRHVARAKQRADGLGLLSKWRKVNDTSEALADKVCFEL